MDGNEPRLAAAQTALRQEERKEAAKEALADAMTPLGRHSWQRSPKILNFDSDNEKIRSM